MSEADGARFRDCDVTLPDGTVGTTIEFDSADPRNFYQAITSPEAAARRVIDGKLFLPGSFAAGGGRVPAVVIVPGSLGVAPSHLAHAATLVGLGAAAFVIDPFGPRAVTSTVANQTQYSFAASAFDVLAALAALSRDPAIDAARIGAQGHSRGGSAVLSAASSRFAGPVLAHLGVEQSLRAVYGAYPWSGQQFQDPAIGATTVRAVIGERDQWCSPQQVQAHINAMRLAGGNATFRLFAGAGHSFDRETPVEVVAEASVSPSAPTTYLADDGSIIHPLTGQPDPALVDRDVMIYAVKAGFGRKGAEIGSSGDQPAQFRQDMIHFWTAELGLR